MKKLIFDKVFSFRCNALKKQMEVIWQRLSSKIILEIDGTRVGERSQKSCIMYIRTFTYSLSLQDTIVTGVIEHSEGEKGQTGLARIVWCQKATIGFVLWTERTEIKHM